eukprot:COSAG04_NODE_30_length_35898_cov_42.288053_13_plen_622_part_00
MVPLPLVALLLPVATPSAAPPAPFPLPFSRALSRGSSGSDVLIAQAFLIRTAPRTNVTIRAEDGTFGPETAAAAADFRARRGLPPGGALDAAALGELLRAGAADGYRDDGRPASARGGQWLYKVRVRVWANRSVEDHGATLEDRAGNTLLTFVARAHGKPGRNQFSTDGDTPTGLFALDFNSPEPDPLSYGPFPINRAVSGLARGPGALRTNAELLLNNGIRSGILLHTGGWNQTLGWHPPEPMPNSEGCIHSWPQFIRRIAQILPTLGVKMRKNPDSGKDYPFQPQGLLSVEELPSAPPAPPLKSDDDGERPRANSAGQAVWSAEAGSTRVEVFSDGSYTVSLAAADGVRIMWLKGGVNQTVIGVPVALTSVHQTQGRQERLGAYDAAELSVAGPRAEAPGEPLISLVFSIKHFPALDLILFEQRWPDGLDFAGANRTGLAAAFPRFDLAPPATALVRQHRCFSIWSLATRVLKTRTTVAQSAVSWRDEFSWGDICFADPQAKNCFAALVRDSFAASGFGEGVDAPLVLFNGSAVGKHDRSPTTLLAVLRFHSDARCVFQVPRRGSLPSSRRLTCSGTSVCRFWRIVRSGGDRTCGSLRPPPRCRRATTRAWQFAAEQAA